MNPTSRRALIGTIAGVVATAASAGLATRRVAAWETAAFRATNGLPGYLAPFVWLPMQAGALAAPLGVGAVLALRNKPEPAVRVAVGGILAWAAAKAVKNRVRRDRPGVDIVETRLRIGSADHGLGFPSGHAAVATVVGISLSEQLGRGGSAIVVAVAGSVGLARIYVGAHYPLDVIGGFGVGLAAASSISLAAGTWTAIGRDHRS